ncbi:MAG: ABC transporter substrate-binding protein [Candidatus Bipolaricaulia bacterium]
MGLPLVSRVLMGLLVVAAFVIGGVSQQAVEITDALGRVVRFERPPERLTLAGKGSFMLVDAAYMFTEARQKIVAFAGGRQLNVGWLALIDPTFRQTKTILEGQVGPEQIAATKPDAVLLRAVEASKLGPAVERLGIPVVYLELETIVDQYLRDFKIMGQIMNNPQRAQAVIEFYQSRVLRIGARTRDLQERPRVLVLNYTQQGGTIAVEVPSAAWIQTRMVELAGGNPVWKGAAQAGGWTVVTFEQIAAWNPDIIFVIDYAQDARAAVARLRGDPLWQALKAVKTNRIFGFPADFYSWDQPDTRWILGLTWLATKLHPQLFADISVLDESRAFFRELYSLTDATINAQILPVLKGDIP